MRAVIAAVLVCATAGPGRAQDDGAPPKGSKAAADAAKAKMETAQNKYFADWVAAVKVQKTAKDMDAGVRGTRWDQPFPGREWYRGKMTPAEFDATLAAIVDGWEAFGEGNASLAAGDANGTTASAAAIDAGVAYAAEDWAAAVAGYALAECDYGYGSANYTAAATSHAVAVCSYACAAALMDMYPNP